MSVQLQKNLKSTGLFSFANATTQETCSDCFNNIKTMMSGQPPKMAKNASTQAKIFYQQFSFFCRELNDDGEQVFGSEAFMIKMKALPAVKTFEELDEFFKFSWLGCFSDARQISLKKQELIKALEAGDDTVLEEKIPVATKSAGGSAGASIKAVGISEEQLPEVATASTAASAAVPKALALSHL